MRLYQLRLVVPVLRAVIPVRLRPFARHAKQTSSLELTTNAIHNVLQVSSETQEQRLAMPVSTDVQPVPTLSSVPHVLQDSSSERTTNAIHNVLQVSSETQELRLAMPVLKAVLPAVHLLFAYYTVKFLT